MLFTHQARIDRSEAPTLLISACFIILALEAAVCHMHKMLRNQLKELGLDISTPPDINQWQRLLTHLDSQFGTSESSTNGFADAAVRAELHHLKAAVREAILLNKVIAAVTSTSDTHTILQIICTQLAQAMNLPESACAILNDARTHLEVVAEYTPQQEQSTLGTIIPVENNPATQFVMETCMPLAVEDVQNDERVATRQISRQRGTVSMLLLPLMIRERVIGTIGVNSPVPRVFNDTEIALAQNVAAAASQALEKADLYRTIQQELAERKRTEQAMRRQNEYLEVLHETALGLINRLDTHSLLEAIVQRAGALSGTEHGYVYVAADGRSDIRMMAGTGVFQEYIGSQLKAGEGLSGEVWKTGKMICVEDYEAWYGRPSKYGRVYGAVSFPLRSGPLVTGVIGLVYLEKRTFGTPELEILERFAQLASLALDNSMLYSALQRELIERERTEVELQAAKEAAESANQIKSNFLASMSHELRTPLNAILGYSEMIQEDIQTLPQAEVLEDVRRIQAAGNLLLEMIDEILDISRIEAGRTHIDLSVFAIEDLIEQILSIVQPMFEHSSNQLKLNIAEPLGLMHSDRVKIRQTIFNLLSNANKFTKNGQITLQVQRYQRDKMDWIQFAVLDTGIGISRRQQKKIFEPFTQVDATMSRQYGGTGLGLAICRHYCELLEGEITVDSRLGAGSRFSVHLPAEVKSVV